jgi:hypothetical protein
METIPLGAKSFYKTNREFSKFHWVFWNLFSNPHQEYLPLSTQTFRHTHSNPHITAIMKVITSWSTVKPNDRIICKVSVFEPTLIPDQKPGSCYYLRITSVNQTDTDFVFDTQYENQNFEPIPGLTKLLTIPLGEDNRFIVLRKP